MVVVGGAPEWPTESGMGLPPAWPCPVPLSPQHPERPVELSRAECVSSDGCPGAWQGRSGKKPLISGREGASTGWASVALSFGVKGLETACVCGGSGHGRAAHYYLLQPVNALSGWKVLCTGGPGSHTRLLGTQNAASTRGTAL